MNRDQLLSQVLFLVLLILHTFAGYAFLHLLYLQFRQYRLGSPAWGGWTWRALTFVLAVHYFNQMWVFLAFALSDAATAQRWAPLNMIHVITRPLIGPLLMQLFYTTGRSRLPDHGLWLALVKAAWALAIPIAVVRGLWFAGLPLSAKLPDALVGVSDALLAAGATYTLVIIWKSRRSDDSRSRRRHRRWYLGIVCALFASLILQLFWWPAWLDPIVEFAMPLAFVLVTIYYGERLTFFDVFAKSALLFAVALVILICCLTMMLPRLGFKGPESRRLVLVPYWLASLGLLPLMLCAPRLFAKLTSWADRSWFGRRFSPQGALENFSESLHGAASEDDLLERAEAAISMVFRSPSCVDRLDSTASGRSQGELSKIIRVSGSPWGTVRVLPRNDEVPFLSQDVRLLGAIAANLGPALEGQIQREDVLKREQRERQLLLNATDAELRALRARINPHFLFNALNIIAALIPKKPHLAERTIEQLAEVFRYTVRQADREWVSVADEIEFVRSYLQIEQVRFGERLCVRIEMEESAAKARIPAMTIQTLAENAVKHGITAVRHSGLITVSAELIACEEHGSKVIVTVSDNGPGFQHGATGAMAMYVQPGGGYGLRHIRERIFAHYGQAAALRIRRDHATATTFVSLEVPAVLDGESCGS